MSPAAHPNVHVMQRLFDAMASGDVAAIGALQAGGFTLTVSGNSAIAGSFVEEEAGRQFQQSMELTNGQMRMAVQHLLADDDVGVALVVATARRPDGREIEQQLMFEVRFDNGKIAAVREWIWDQEADRAFWS